MLFSKLLFVVGCSLGLAVAEIDPQIGRGIFDEGEDMDMQARMKERREYMESRRAEADAKRASRRSEPRGRDRDDFRADGMDHMHDREAYLAEKRAEMARRHADREIDGMEDPLAHIEGRHREHRQKMEEDMSTRHNDMLLRRAERYRSRAESSTLTEEDKQKVEELIEQYVAKEKDMMDTRLSAKADRMRPSGDMRDPAVKEQFKADLRRSIDERKEKDRVLRDEIRDLRHRLDEMLNAHPGADL